MFFEDSELGKRHSKKKLFQEVTTVLHRAHRAFNAFTDEELRTVPTGAVFVFDAESYPNYFCVSFKHIDSGKIVYFEDSPDSQIDLNKLRFMLWHFCLVGFNSENYDIPIVALACNGYRAEDLNRASRQIVNEDYFPKDIEREWNIEIPRKINHIDLFDVAPLDASLKIYAGRLHCERMQDLPYHYTLHLSKEQAKDVLYYNVNDLDNTELLYRELCPQIRERETLSREYGIDLRSRSDAQLAEKVIVSELTKVNGYKPKKPKNLIGTTFQYNVPAGLSFDSPALQAALDAVRRAVFVVGANGAPILPASLEALAVPLGGCVYRMGIGGLHSSEKCAFHQSDDDTDLIDRDVASYYPWMILNQGLYPKHLGPAFLEVFRSLVFRRLDAKAAGNKVVADSLKITINGTFGKLGDMFSFIYAPDLLLQVTISGQLYLLKLIEMIVAAGIPVVSANTDGIIIKCPKKRKAELDEIIKRWEKLTSLTTEETLYRAIFSRDVNNYYALKDLSSETEKEKAKRLKSRFLFEQLGFKPKGVYSEVGSALNSVLSKNPEALICSDAVEQLIANGTPIEQTIYACKDIRRFVCIKTARNGAHKDGVYLGKAIRWYYGKGVRGQIHSVKSGNAVANTEGAKPCMDLPPQFPSDIDCDWYINKAVEMLYEIGYYAKKQASLF